MPPYAQGLVAKTAAEQRLQLGAKQLLGLKLLAKSLPELRTEIQNEMSVNPAIEDIDHPLEKALSAVEKERERDEREPDYPEDDFVPGRNYDEEKLERRQNFINNQVGVETLQQHLLAQLPTSDIPRDDWPLVEMIVGDLNDNGYYVGSASDMMMVFGKSEREFQAIRAQVMQFDPAGCGATTARECLLAQMDKLVASPHYATARRLVASHLDDIAAGRFGKIIAALGITREAYEAALKDVRSLNPHPGRAFPGERDSAEYVNPEVHVRSVNGWWTAFTDERSLPELRVSKRFEALLKDPQQTEETKKYVRERLAAAESFREAIRNRQKTVSAIAQAICDHQQDFFEEGFKALKPLTEQAIADEVGVVPSTVARTVRNKYAETPFGTVELRKFFATGVQAANGEMVTQQAVLERLKAIIAAEDAHRPLSDEKIAAQLKADGYPLARRTVAKYRDLCGIPGIAGRRAR